MKKLMFTALAVVGFSAVGMAQQQLKFGPKAGVNLATLSGMDDTQMKVGFYVGAVAEIKFNDKFSLQPELLYSAQGTKLKDSDATMNNDYINVPVMAKYYFTDGLSVELGPQFGFLINSESKDGDLSMDTNDFYRSFDLGLGVGLAYDLPMGLFVSARYNLGLTSANEDFSFGPISIATESYKNNVIQVGVGFKFD